MRTVILFAGAALVFGAGCSDFDAPLPAEPARADCSHDPDCIQIAFVGFRGETAELLMNGQAVFQGVLQTQDWSTASSGSAEFRSPNLSHIRLKIDQKIVYDRAVTERGVRTIYVQPLEPYVHLTDDPVPLLD